MIIKIQRSLFSSTGVSTMLIYDKRRSVQTVLPLDPAIDHALHGRAKGYFETRVTDGGKLVIGERVPDQDW